LSKKKDDIETSIPKIERFVSFSDVLGEWDNRKISLFGVARSIISQLTSSGTDLTHVGLPSVFLQPFSLLELAASRYLGYFDLLLNLTHIDNEIERMITVLRWFLTYTSEEEPDKKPYNPVIGETHKCKVKSEIGDSKFFAEQVSHHPPISAFYIGNKERTISVLGNMAFGVQYAMNSVICTTSGFVEVYVPRETGEEIYHIDKGLPDLLINNVIFGTRTMGWTGNISISCSNTNITVPLTFSKNKNRITVSGKIIKNDIEIFELKGNWREQPIYAQPLIESMENNEVLSPILIFDPVSREKLEIEYPETFKVPELNTFKVWGIVTEGIVKNDTNLSDIEKQRIEAEQRKRIKSWTNDHFIYFKFDDQKDKWVFEKKKKLNKES